MTGAIISITIKYYVSQICGKSRKHENDTLLKVNKFIFKFYCKLYQMLSYTAGNLLSFSVIGMSFSLI